MEQKEMIMQLLNVVLETALACVNMQNSLHQSLLVIKKHEAVMDADDIANLRKLEEMHNASNEACNEATRKLKIIKSYL